MFSLRLYEIQRIKSNPSYLGLADFWLLCRTAELNIPLLAALLSPSMTTDYTNLDWGEKWEQQEDCQSPHGKELESRFLKICTL